MSGMTKLWTVDGRAILEETDGSGRGVLRREDWALGLHIRLERERAGYTRAAAARLAGFSPQAWTTLETGIVGAPGGRGYRTNNAAEQSIRAAAAAIGADPDECMRIANYATLPHPGPGDRRARPSTAKLVQMLDAVPIDARTAIIDTIEAVYKMAKSGG